MESMIDYNAALALVVSEYRGEMSMRDLAKISGVSASTISRIEAGKGCSIEAAAKIGAALGFTPGNFMMMCFSLAESEK